MADTVATIRPNAAPGSAGWTIGGGAGSLDAAASDNSDSTYADDGGTATQPLSLALADPSVPAGAVIHSVTPRVRLSRPAGGGTCTFYLLDPLFGVFPPNAVGADASLVTYTGVPLTRTADGRPWTAGDIANVIFEVAYGQGAQVFEAYADVAYNQRPSVTVSAPTGVITTESNPSVAWSYSDPESDAQERFQVKIFNAAQYGAGGFDPTSSASVYDSGEQLGTAGSWQPPSSYVFGNGAYRAYVRAADAGSGGRYGDWAHSGYTITVDPPATPTVAATADDAAAKVDLIVQARDNRLTLNQADLETDTTGWANFSNATLARDTGRFLHGGASLQLTAIADGDVIARTPQGTSGVPVVAGETLTVMASFDRGGSVGHVCQVAVVHFDSAGTYVPGDITSAQVNTGTSSWPQASATGVAPAGAAYAAVEVRVVAASTGNDHYVDEISLAGGTSTTWTRGGLFNPSLRVYVEVSLDGGSTWRAQAGSPVAVGVDEKAPLHDYVAARGVPLKYRAYTVAVDGSSLLTSDYSAAATAELAVEDDWLKDPLDPTRNIAVCLEAPLSSTSDERQVVGEPFGTPFYNVQGDVARGEVFLLALSFSTDAEWAAFETLRKSLAVLLLQTTWGDGAGPAEQFYVRLGPTRSTTRVARGGGVGQLRLVTVGAREVAPPVV